MDVMYGEGKTEYGSGVSIRLDGSEVATAIDAYLVAHGICVRGPRTITINGKLCETGHIYVDPTGFVVDNGEKVLGRGPNPSSKPTPNSGIESNEPCKFKDCKYFIPLAP